MPWFDQLNSAIFSHYTHMYEWKKQLKYLLNQRLEYYQMKQKVLFLFHKMWTLCNLQLLFVLLLLIKQVTTLCKSSVKKAILAQADIFIFPKRYQRTQKISNLMPNTAAEGSCNTFSLRWVAAGKWKVTRTLPCKFSF